MLGHDLVATKPPGVDLVPLLRTDVDITDAAALEKTFRRLTPDIVINAAAYTAVDKAETERELAFLVNAKAVETIGRLAARTLVVHYSTDYVFPGTGSRPYREDDPVDPINVYGASKLAGERALQNSGARYLLVRTSWLFGVHGRSFPRTMWERARAGQVTRVVNDQRGRPTYTVDLAVATWQLVHRGATGLLHVANTGESTWYQIARELFARASASNLLSPCTTDDYPTPARRPPFSVLGTARAEALLSHSLPDWQTAVDRFLAELNVQVAN
jgi:dTDP-4-dehydrorhamnose reductase